jgi:hypothetical protein
MYKERIRTVQKHDMYTGFDRKSHTKRKIKENDSIKNSVFEKNLRAVFGGIVTDYSFDVLCSASNLRFSRALRHAV